MTTVKKISQRGLLAAVIMLPLILALLGALLLILVSSPALAADGDGDRVRNAIDNCPTTYNPYQVDADNDGIGNRCDPQDNRDLDGDGIQNYQDTCPNEAGQPPNGCPLTRVSVIDHGATANDSTNDSQAFENAMAASGPDEAVYVPSGTYRLANVDIPSDTTVEIESTATIKRFGTGSAAIFVMQGVSNTSFAQNIHVLGVNGKFKMDLSDASQGTAGFRVRSVKNFSIKNMDATGRANDPWARYDPNGSILRPVISFLPVDTTKLNGEWEHAHDGVIENISATNQAFGWGLTQLTGAEDIHFQDLTSTGGVTIRFENFQNNATTIDDITADNVTCIDGHDALLVNPHNALNGDFHVTDVTADSCWQALSLEDDPEFPNAGFDPASTIDRVSVIPGSTAQVRNLAGSFGAWLVGDSEWCVDSDRNLIYSIQITNLSCGGQPNRNWPQ